MKAGENLFISGSLARPGGSRSEIPSFLRALRSQLLHTTSSPVSLNLLRPRYEDTCWCRRVFAASDSSGACRQHLLDATFHPLPLSLSLSFPFSSPPCHPLIFLILPFSLSLSASIRKRRNFSSNAACLIKSVTLSETMPRKLT